MSHGIEAASKHPRVATRLALRQADFLCKNQRILLRICKLTRHSSFAWLTLNTATLPTSRRKSTHEAKNRASRERAFTLVELLIVIAVIAIVVSMLLPGVAAAKAKALQAHCVSNHRQLVLTSALYAGDNDDRLARNGYIAPNGESARPLWVQGYYNHTSSPRDSTNAVLMADPKYALFALYLKTGDISVYHCPADRGVVTIKNIPYPRLRSYGMNWSLAYDGVGGGNGIPDFVFQKSTVVVWPSATLVAIDVASNSICWPFFGIFQTPSFQMLPGRYHRNGAVASFADGHLEYRHWRDPRTFNPPSNESWHGHNYASVGNSDLAWLQSKAGKP